MHQMYDMFWLDVFTHELSHVRYVNLLFMQQAQLKPLFVESWKGSKAGQSVGQTRA